MQKFEKSVKSEQSKKTEIIKFRFIFLMFWLPTFFGIEGLGFSIGNPGLLAPWGPFKEI